MGPIRPTHFPSLIDRNRVRQIGAITAIDNPRLLLVGSSHPLTCAHPNILVNRVSSLRVVDWESAEKFWLPAADLYFFLSLVASAIEGVQTVNEQVQAFERALFCRYTRARKYLGTYTAQTGFDTWRLIAVFVLTWCRYLSARISRVRSRYLDPGTTVEQITSDRYYAFLSYTLEHVDDLAWMEHVGEGK